MELSTNVYYTLTSNTSFDVTWDDLGCEYEIYLDGEVIDTVSTNQYTFENLETETEYYVCVKPLITFKKATETINIPAYTKIYFVDSTETSVEINYNSNFNNIQGWKIYWAKVDEFDFNNLLNNNNTNTTNNIYIIENLEPNIQYRIVVIPYNDIEDGPSTHLYFPNNSISKKYDNYPPDYDSSYQIHFKYDTTLGLVDGWTIYWNNSDQFNYNILSNNNIINTTENVYTLTNLIPSTSYTIISRPYNIHGEYYDIEETLDDILEVSTYMDEDEHTDVY